MAQLISKRYGSALFDLACEYNKIDEFYEDVNLVHNIISGDKDLLKILNDPQIDSEEKLNILDKAFKGKITQEVLDFFGVVFRKNREEYLLEMLEVFIEAVKENKGIVSAEIFSAKELSSSQLDRIKDSLSKKLNKQVEIHAMVDPTLMGGMKIKVDGHLIDNTVKRQLNDIKNGLMDIKLASKGV